MDSTRWDSKTNPVEQANEIGVAAGINAWQVIALEGLTIKTQPEGLCHKEAGGNAVPAAFAWPEEGGPVR
jgi:hypothetical protein